MPRHHPGHRKGPRMITEILKLKKKGLGTGKIAKALSISRNTVKTYLRQQEQAIASGLVGPVANATVVSPPKYSASWSPLVNWDVLKAATDKGEALFHYWEYHIVTSADVTLKTLKYNSFWREFKRRYPEVPLEFHKIHPPGERAEFDYKGDAAGLGYIDRVSGKYIQCRLFGNIMCFSQFFYAEATHTERQEDFLPAVVGSFVYFGGVPATLAHDNTKAAVTKAHRYDPDFNPEFFHFCELYGTAPVAARPRSPKDKNLIENILGVFWRWARLRFKGKTFYSLGELNAFLRELLDIFNDRIQRKYGQSRRQKFAAEQSKLLPLPSGEYRVGIWKKHRLHPDCHIQVGYNFYSAPYQYRSEDLDVRVTSQTIEIFHHLERLAVHIAFPNKDIKGGSRGGYRTNDTHLPPSHLALKEATPQQVMETAFEIGPATSTIISNLITKSRHPLMYLRRALGITRLAKRYSNLALENACSLLVSAGIEQPRLKDLEEIITNEKSRKYAESLSKAVVRKPNPNLRGQNSWSANLH